MSTVKPKATAELEVVAACQGEQTWDKGREEEGNARKNSVWNPTVKIEMKVWNFMLKNNNPPEIPKGV